MAEKGKLSQRDQTLVKILDRLSDDIRNQDIRLEETKNRLLELFADIERAWAKQHARHDFSDVAIEKTQSEIQRYRSDMLSLVNEQDRMNAAMIDLTKKQAAIAYSQDNLVNTMKDLSKRLEVQEKAVHDIGEHSEKHEETLTSQLKDLSRNVAKLHMDTEKRLGEMHTDTHRLLRDMKADTIRRLLALDKIEESLGVLLIRTEPRQKKPFILVRLFRRIRMFCGKIRLRRR